MGSVCQGVLPRPPSLQTQQLFEPHGLSGGNIDALAAPDFEQQAAFVVGVDFFDGGEVEDLLAIDAEEEVGRQFVFELLQGLVEQGRVRAEIDPDVVAHGFEEGDVGEADEVAVLAVFEKNLAVGGEAEAGGGVGGGGVGGVGVAGHPCQGLGQALGVDGLERVLSNKI